MTGSADAAHRPPGDRLIGVHGCLREASTVVGGVDSQRKLFSYHSIVRGLTFFR